MQISNKISNIIAAFFLLACLCLSLAVMSGDSLTMDEKSHLPAGYSYITQKDMRINPEHPPLVKDLAGLPLLLVPGINFPYTSEAWTTMVNGQWDFGETLLFKMQNPADKMIFLGRLPMIMLMLLLGIFVYKWTRQLYGNFAGLLALFLYSFSPTFLAHGHLVTTDVAAALGAFVASYYFVKSLQKPTLRNIIASGVALGIAELLKFSMILLFPTFILLTLICWSAKMINFTQLFRILAVSFSVCFLVIWPVYQFHVWNYPPQKQISDSKSILETHGFKLGTAAIVWAADKPILRPYAQYFLGVMMVTQRVSGGNTTYFFGEVSKTSWRSYFPIMYLVKETIAFHLLTLIAVVVALTQLKNLPRRNFIILSRQFIAKYLPQLAMVLFIAIYWTSSIGGNLNIGIRHLLPVFPFTILLAAGGAAAFARGIFWRRALIGALCVWQLTTVLLAYPSFLAYYNEFSGGMDNGYKIAVDSNTDWGQDLKRLKIWTQENNISQIYIDYFGGADAKYYFGDRYQAWWSSRDKNELPPDSYLAVSATFLQGQRAIPKPGMDIKSGEYSWLNAYQPVAVIGHSIFVYRID